MTNDARSHIYSVSKLNRLAKHILEAEIGQIWLLAEISNFVAAASGHWYFTLKDDKAQIKSAMFRNSQRRNGFKPKNGDKVLVRGSVGLYEPRGDFQLIASHLEAAGEGHLQRQFEMIKQKLAQEGLFAATHKRALPPNPRKIGVITSSTGAAWRDIVTVLQRRNPTIQIVLYPSQVQGDSAPQQLRQALRTANARQEVELLIVGRGGGSMEDLWCFNDEQLARDIFASAIPVISAVGHEIDFTIADFVADVRAATPSAAAELSSAPLDASFTYLRQLLHTLTTRWHALKTSKHNQQALIVEKLRRVHPQSQLRQQQQTLDHLLLSLTKAVNEQLGRRGTALQMAAAHLNQCHPGHQVQQQQQVLANLTEKQRVAMHNLLRRKQQIMSNQGQLLDSISPLATLARGYSVTLSGDSVVRRADSLSAGDTITTRLHRGKVVSKVIATE